MDTWRHTSQHAITDYQDRSRHQALHPVQSEPLAPEPPVWMEALAIQDEVTLREWPCPTGVCLEQRIASPETRKGAAKVDGAGWPVSLGIL